jgi:hypothetical protein
MRPCFRAGLRFSFTLDRAEAALDVRELKGAACDWSKLPQEKGILAHLRTLWRKVQPVSDGSLEFLFPPKLTACTERGEARVFSSHAYESTERLSSDSSDSRRMCIYEEPLAYDTAWTIAVVLQLPASPDMQLL